MNTKHGTYFKVAGVINLIVGIISCITIVGLCWGIPLIISYNKYMQWSTMSAYDLREVKGSILGWGIFSVIFCTISGIFGILGYMELDQPDDTKEAAREIGSVSDKLQRLEKLRNEGTISEEEFQKLKKELIVK